VGSSSKKFIHYLPVFGCISTGIIYSAIGVIAILSFLKVKNGGADETSLLVFMNGYVLGKILIIIIISGTLSYIIWRIYETIKDPYQYGSNAKGLAKRTGIALSTIADILIVYASVLSIFGVGSSQTNGEPDKERAMVSNLLEHNWGPLLVESIGIAIVITAAVQLFYGVTKGYKERMEVEEFRPWMKKIVFFFGLSGYFARSIIIGIIGWFYIKAGIENNGQLIVNTDKAFDFIGDNIGHVYFILIAAGTIFYGLFMFFLAMAYDIDKD
jgi:hypothetical protein